MMKICCPIFYSALLWKNSNFLPHATKFLSGHARLYMKLYVVVVI